MSERERETTGAIESLRRAMRYDDPMSQLSIVFDRPVLTYPGEHFMEHSPGPRTLLVIEGENELIQPYLDALSEVYADERKARPEIYRRYA